MHCCICVTSKTNTGRGEITGVDTRKKGMALPFTPLSITFNNIRYSVDMPQVSITQARSSVMY